MCTEVDVTRCFEFAALQAALQEPSMEACTIPNRATLLTRQLLQILLPLLRAQKASKKSLSTLELDLLGEEARLTEAFKLAIQVKTRLLLSTDLYRCVHHLPGIRPDGTMTADLESSTVSSGLASRIGLTLCPGLHSYSANERDLNFNRFLKNGQAPEDVSWETWCKPVVLLM